MDIKGFYVRALATYEQSTLQTNIIEKAFPAKDVNETNWEIHGGWENIPDVNSRKRSL